LLEVIQSNENQAREIDKLKTGIEKYVNSRKGATKSSSKLHRRTETLAPLANMNQTMDSSTAKKLNFSVRAPM